jgi:hypothetical protein
MPVVRICWVDARSDDGWTERKDLDIRLAEITTVGMIVEENEHVLCVASSLDKVTGQLSGIMFIPKKCVTCRSIIWRVKTKGEIEYDATD